MVRAVAGPHHSRARAGRRVRVARSELGRRPEHRAAAGLLLHRPGHLDAARRLGGRASLRLVRASGAAVLARALRQSRSHAQIPLRGRSAAEPGQSGPAADRFHQALRSSHRSVRTRYHLRRLPHRRNPFHQGQPHLCGAYRWRSGHARLHGYVARQLRAGAAGFAARHGSEAVEVRSFRTAGTRPWLSGCQIAVEVGTVGDHQGHAGQRPEQSSAQALPGA